MMHYKGRTVRVTSLSDNTYLKQAEEKLKASEQLYRNLFDQANEGLILLTMDGKIAEVNQSFAAMHGFTVDELKNTRINDLDVLREKAFEGRAEVMRRINAGEVVRFEVEHYHKDGHSFILSDTASLITIGNQQFYLAFHQDITERKQVESELVRAKEKAEESDRLKSAFLANISHEIRTPMNAILGFSNLLKEPHLSDEEQQEYINNIDKGSKRMINIISDIVDISKIESRQMEVQITDTDVNDKIEFLYNLYKPEASLKGIQIFYRNALQKNEAVIKTDREKLFSILSNLVINAIQYTNEGSIEFGYEKKGETLEFFVKDTGIGVPEQYKELIFERFRQGNDLTRKFTEGAGLGLSISKAYVELLGGNIWVESEVGQGSVFYFTIPYITEEQIQSNIKNILRTEEESGQAKKLKILIAEDDEVSVLLLSAALRMHCREIVTVGNGIEAVEAGRTNPDIDLFLMDLKMPEMDGFEAARQIRQFNKDVIIIAQTAFGLTGDKEKAIDAGCDAFIAKPIVLEELKGLIREYFN